MSRCFPYPTPGLAKDQVKDLSELIKLQKEVKKAHKERRPDRKHEKKYERAKEDGAGTRHDEKKADKRHKKGSTHPSNCSNKKDQGMDQVEKSGITEERGQPAKILSQVGSTNSSDSTENSGNKRKRKETFTNLVQNVSYQGSGLRIRLPLRKETVSGSNNQTQMLLNGPPSSVRKSHQSSLVVNCPLLRCRDIVTDKQHKICDASTVVTALPLDQSGGRFSSGAVQLTLQSELVDTQSQGQTVERVEGVCAADHQQKHEGKVTERKHRSRKEKKDSEFKELFMDWKPPLLNAEVSQVEDLSWLNVGKEPRKQEDSRGRVSVVEMHSCMPARARFLPEVDKFALPYVLPF